MRRIIIGFVCVMIAPLAFAQTKKTTVQQTNTTQPAAFTETATRYGAGTVRKYEPGKTMMVDSTQGPVSFALGANAQIVNNAGDAVTSPLKPGERVRVYYTGSNQDRMVERVVVGFVCMMIAPLAFAQTVAKTSAVEHTGQVQRAPTQMTTGAVKIGTVMAFNPGQKPIEPASPIVVQSSPDVKPVSYELGKRVRFVDKDGRAVDPRIWVRPGARVELGFDRRGRVTRVIVVEKE